jgi:selenocysteine lyase/cysteine desulfurase
MARTGSEDFARLVEYTDEFRDGARRFDMGEFSEFVLVPMAAAGLRQVLAWGVENVARAIGELTDRIARDAAALGCTVPDAGDRVRHMLGVRLPGGIPPELADRLAAQNVHVSIRGDVIRVSPHLYNDERDVERLMTAMR